MSTYERHDEEVETPSGVVVESTSASSFSVGPGQVLGGIVGVVFCGFGVLAITRAGIDTTLNQPTVDVAGFTHSAAVGIGEVVAGLLLLAGAASVRSRALMGATGGLMFIAGILIAAASPELLEDIGADQRTGWLILFGGVLAMIAAALPVMVRSAHRVQRTAR